MINQVSWLGAGVGYSVWNPTVKKVYRTQPESVIGPDGNNINLGFASRQRVNVRNLNVLNVSLNPLNYYQNQTIHDSDDSDFQGHIERTMLGKYLAMVKKKEPLTGGYDKENIEKCLKNTIQSAKVDSRFEHLLKNQEWSTLTTDVTHWFGNIWIEGNEEDMEDYMVELIDGKIVRFLENPYDEGMSPYTVYQIDERPEYWWGNTDSELVTPHENLMNLLVGMKADNTIRNLEQLIFYRRGTLNPGDINDRHKSGGWIPVDVKDNSALSQLIHRDQGRDVSTNDLDQTIRLVLDSAQRLTPSADLGRPSFAGGVQNKTATAAIQLGEREDVLESDLTETFTYGLKATARKTVLMLQEFLPDQFPIRPDPRGMQELINKTNILGDFDYQVESSLTKNKVQESITLQNTLTQLLNFRLVDQQSIANVDLTKLYREWLKRQNLPVDIDDILPETIQNAVAPQALGMGADVTGAFSPGELAEVPVAPGFNADINTPVSERAQTTGVGIGLR